MGEIGLWLGQGRKATQPEAGRRDRSRISERHGGAVSARVRDKRDYEDFDRQLHHYDGRQYGHHKEGRVSKKVGGNYDAMNKSDYADGKDGSIRATENVNGSKVSFYFTNFSEFMYVVQLRQFFEVCGMLSNVYIARKQNYRGQVYGFLRFLNVKNSDKLALALNNVWIGLCRIWAREARFDRFVSVSLKDGRRKLEKEESLPVVRVTGKGVKNVRVGRSEEGKRGEGEK